MFDAEIRILSVTAVPGLILTLRSGSAEAEGEDRIFDNMLCLSVSMAQLISTGMSKSG